MTPPRCQKCENSGKFWKKSGDLRGALRDPLQPFLGPPKNLDNFDFSWFFGGALILSEFLNFLLYPITEYIGNIFSVLSLFGGKHLVLFSPFFHIFYHFFFSFKLIFTEKLEMFEDELMLDDFDDNSSSSFGGINSAPSVAHLRFYLLHSIVRIDGMHWISTTLTVSLYTV